MIRVQNYGGVGSVQLDGQVILLAGKGGAGKTSILSAVAAAITGNARPAGMPKSAAGQLIRPGFHSAAVTVEDENGRLQVTWPACDVMRKGTPITASPIAGGQVQFLDLTTAERTKLVVAALQALPTPAELAAELIDAGLTPESANALAVMAEKRGYDDAHETAKKERVERAALWRATTGAKAYLPATAGDWRPENWDLDLEAVTDGAPLTEAVTAARKAVENAIANAATDSAELARLKARAGLLDEARRRLTEAELATRRASDLTIHWGKRVDGLARIPEVSSHRCPACGEPLTGSGPYYEGEAEDGDLDGIEDIRKQHKDYRDEQAKAEMAARGCVAAEAVIRAEVEKITADAHKLDKLQMETREGGGAVTDPAPFRRRLEDTERRLQGWTQWRKASTLLERVRYSDICVSILAPDGARKKALTSKLAAFNRRMAEISDMGEHRVVLAEDMSVTYGGIPSSVVSTSGRFLINTIMQIALAENDGSRAILIDVDRALDSKQKSDVINMALAADESISLIMVVVTETAPRKSLDLGAAGITYWIEGAGTANGATAKPILEKIYA